MKKLLLFLAMILCWNLQAQIISTTPAFPTVGDDITLIYDATEGNGALSGVVPVYAHMGLITENSNDPSDWQYVQGNWGTADPKVFMTPLGNNLHRIQFSIPDFFGIDTTQETVQQLAFVFRNVNGTVVGREADGSDIYYDIFPSSGSGLFVNLTPNGPEIVELNDVISITGNASVSSTLTLFEDNVQIAQTTGTEINYDLTVTSPGSHTVRLVADNGSTTVEDEFTYVVNPAVNTASLPTLNSKLGVNYLSSTSVRLVLHAPLKNYVYVLGTFNDFTPDVNYFMNRTPSGDTWWIDITGLTAGETYAFQYFVDGEIKVADPFSELILDPSNDSNIEDPETFPNLPAYPENASGALTVITPGATPYNWQIDNFQRPDKEDLVIYELLVRDFIDAHDYDTLLDSLDYLANLGVNAIQFMPIQEFEGNISWGYNPSFHMAVDKYYGTPDQLKAFIDACHTRGIAVILDVVFNHVFSQSPLAQLWWNSAGFRPATNNPYLNEYATHPFNVGYDVNHETQAAKDWMDRVVQHWITEYRFDGFRFDLSKGFTQVQSCNNTGGACNVGFWSSYDQSRIDLLTRLYDETVAVDDVYMILEHLADNSEEIVLANYGYMLWGNGNVNYNQATMGYDNSNFDYASNYQARGWNDPHLVSYMESHDEQRLMYRNLEFGNSNGNYDVTNLATALDRVELATAFFYSIPGPKMLWQFGEVGYDFPINYCPDGSIQEPCRVDPKPIRWDYFQDPDRRDLYDMTSQMIKLKTNLEVFSTTNYTLDLSNDFTKRIHLNGSDRNITVLGNFDVVGNNNFVPNFQNTGWWYEYFSGDSILVSNTQAPLSFGPGEYRLYSDVRIDPSDVSTSIFAPQITNAFELNVFPNPTVSKGQINLSYHLPEGGRVIIELFDAFGRKVTNLVNQQQASGNYQLPIDLNQQELAPGLYLIRITHNQQQGVRKLLVSPE